MTVPAGHGPLDGQAAVVTGAATGIGAAIAARLAEAGARVLIADVDQERLAASAAAIGAESAPVDVRSRESVLGLARAAADQLGPHGIRANAICPGCVDTEMGRRLAAEWGMTIAELAERDQVIKRPIQPEEIGNAAVFLASSQIITGQALNVDGGLVFS